MQRVVQLFDKSKLVEFVLDAGNVSVNVTVGLSGRHPLVDSPVLGSYALCGRYHPPTTTNRPTATTTNSAATTQLYYDYYYAGWFLPHNNV